MRSISRHRYQHLHITTYNKQILGKKQQDGFFITKNDSEAIKWYKKSAEQGIAKAQFNMGLCYYNGWGIAKNYSEAVKWFKKAAQQGNAGAIEALKKLENRK